MDIGAHVGFVTVPASYALAAGGRLVAFEPGAANRRFLERHLRVNRIANVDVEPLLVGDTDAEAVEFHEAEGDSGMNSRAALRADHRRVERPQTSLDSYCARKGLAPQVVKIDVEGAELAVLRGARHVLKTHKPLLILSLHPRELAALGVSADDVEAELRASEYSLEDPDGSPATRLAATEYVARPLRP